MSDNMNFIAFLPFLNQAHGQKAVWEDPVEWVRGTLPWPNAQQDQSRLFHLPPPSTGPPSEEKKPPKDTQPPSTLESDPLVRETYFYDEGLIKAERERVGCVMLDIKQTVYKLRNILQTRLRGIFFPSRIGLIQVYKLVK